MILSSTPVAVTLAMLAQASWSASLGTEQFSYRDVSRTKPPVDASPVRWEGSGPSLTVVRESAAPRRHRLTFEYATAGGFEYVGPVRSVAAAAGDDVTRIEGRYEYRRYPWRDILVSGLDTAIGVEASGRRLSMTRGEAAVASDVRSLDAGVAIVAAAQLHHWGRWDAGLTWTNGIRITRDRESFAGAPGLDVRLWGGGWRTDLLLAGRFRIARTAWLTASWLTTGEGTDVSHHSYAFDRRRFTAGVAYAR